MKSDISSDAIKPIHQLRLFGYDNYFKFFKNLYKKNKLPNVILLSGQKGIGKATFAYHFINYLLSINEKNPYSIDKFSINPNNSSYKLIRDFLHPNFFLLEKEESTDSVKMLQTRKLLAFLSKTTYSKNIKIVLFDDTEFLNINSSNSLLESLEEPIYNTFFIIIDNNVVPIIDTIKSRCIPYKIHFTFSEKKEIFKRIATDNKLDLVGSEFNKILYSNTPGFLLKILKELKDSNLNISDNYLSCIFFLIEKYNLKKSVELLHLITLLIENYYSELSLKNINKIKNYAIDKNKILYLIRYSNKFHLDSKNLIFSIYKILKNEAA